LATATRKGVKLYKPDLAQISNELERPRGGSKNLKGGKMINSAIEGPTTQGVVGGDDIGRDSDEPYR